MSHATTWMNFEDLMPSDKHRVIPLLRGTQSTSQRQSGAVAVGGRGAGGEDLLFRGDRVSVSQDVKFLVRTGRWLHYTVHVPAAHLNSGETVHFTLCAF